MSSNTASGTIVRVSKKGQATIPKELRERFGIEAPGRVLFREEAGKIVVEPLPTVEEMQGIHAGRYERGEVIELVRAMRAADATIEQERDERLEPGG